MGNAERLFTEGLLHGYGTEQEFSTIQRGGVEFKVHHYESSLGVYEDQWTNGGGQETITLVDGNQFTRTYGGETASEAFLNKLGTNQGEVIKFLISTIQTLKGKTRLYSNCQPYTDGSGFRYEYGLNDIEYGFAFISSTETIYYKDEKVFIHRFTISPVKHD